MARAPPTRPGCAHPPCAATGTPLNLPLNCGRQMPPAPRSRSASAAHDHRLRLRVEVEGLLAVLLAVARGLPAAEGQLVVDLRTGVDPRVAGLDALCGLARAVQIPCPHR